MATGTVDLTPDPSTIQVKDLTPDPATIKAKTPPSKSLKAAKAIATGAPVVGQEPWLVRGLEAPGREVSAFAARGSLTGAAESPKQNDADLDALITRIPLLNDLQKADGPGFARFVAGSLFDPTTFAGGSGLLKRVFGSASMKAAPALAKLMAKMPEVEGVKPIEEAMKYFVYGGKTKMDLAKILNPEQAATVFAHARAAKSVAHQATDDMGEAETLAMKEFQKRIAPLIKGMQAGKRITKDEKAKVAQLGAIVGDFLGSDPKSILQHATEHKIPAMALGLLRKTIDLPKQVLVGSSPLRHMQNIGFLGAWHYPQAMPRALLDFAKSLASPALKESILKHATEQGLTSGKAAESSQFLQAIEHIPLIGRMAGGAAVGGYSGWKQGGAPGALAGAGIGAVGGAIAPKWYKKSTEILWMFDHVVKSSALRSVAMGYMKHMPESDAWARAAKDVGDRLVNYDEASPFIKDLRYVMPFATWQVKSVGSMLRGLAEHPERAQMVLRAWPAAGGDYQKTGDVRVLHAKPSISKKTGRVTRAHTKREPLGATTSTPLAEMARRTADPAAWLRASMGAPYQALAGAAEQGLLHEKFPYSTYGQNPAAWAIQASLQAPGMPSMFGDLPLDQLIYGQTGIGQRALPKP